MVPLNPGLLEPGYSWIAPTATLIRKGFDKGDSHGYWHAPGVGNGLLDPILKVSVNLAPDLREPKQVVGYGHCPDKAWSTRLTVEGHRLQYGTGSSEAEFAQAIVQNVEAARWLHGRIIQAKSRQPFRIRPDG